LLGVIPTVSRALGHLTADLLQGASIGVHIFEDMAHAIVTAFEFTEEVVGDDVTMFLVDEFNIMDVMEPIAEAPESFRDFGFGIHYGVDEFGHQLAGLLGFPSGSLTCGGDAFKEVGIVITHFFFFFMALESILLPVSAWLKSLATLGGMPTFFANAGLWAAAAMVRACLGDLLGI
jgi:hypothetical protein